MKTSHTTQVAAFGKLIGFCNANGAMYKPVKESLTVTALNSLLTSAQQSLEAVKSFEAAFNHAVGTRKETFDNLPKLITRIISAMKGVDATALSVAEAKRIQKKFVRKAKQRPAAPDSDSTPSEPPATRRSGNLAFTHQADNFGSLLKVLADVKGYNANEQDLTTSALEGKLDQLRKLNESVTLAFIQLKAARDIRDQYLYADNGIKGTSMKVKNYLKGAFGYQSDPYEQVKKISFTKRHS